jgi:hypothetical protein
MAEGLTAKHAVQMAIGIRQGYFNLRPFTRTENFLARRFGRFSK